MYSKTIMCGRLTADPTERKTTDGRAFCTMRLACQRRGKDAATDFWSLALGGKVAQIALAHLHKGSYIQVEGRIRNNNRQDEEGRIHRDVVMDVYEFQFLSPPARDAAAPEAQQAPLEAAEDAYDYEDLMRHCPEGQE